MKQIILALSAFFVLSISSKAQKDFVNVYNLQDATQFETEGVIYALPQNKITVTVTVQKHVIKTGPFKQYAEKYLGDANVNQNDKVAWEITQIQFGTEAIPDTAQYYFVENMGHGLASFLTLDENLFLHAINGSNLPENTSNEPKHKVEQQSRNTDKLVSYARITTRQSMVEKIDTVYKQVQQDSMTVRVPIVRRQLVEKTDEQKAKEIAELLFLLRDDKNALLTGEGDGNALPDGVALQTMVAELDKLENEYMALFIGKSWTEQYTYHYEFTPRGSINQERSILFRFSPQQGILPASDPKGQAVMLEIQQLQQHKPIVDFLERQKRFRLKPLKENGLVYRIPGTAQIKLQQGNTNLASSQLPLAQYGTLSRLPVDILKRTNYRVIFNPLYGSLLQIQQLGAEHDK